MALGKTVYIKKGCTACHTVDGSPRVGPSWKQPDWGKTIELASGGSVTMEVRTVVEVTTVRKATTLQYARPVS